MKIWHFSDTHTYHAGLKIPEGIDIAIFSGDCSNVKDPYQNEQEVLNFLAWYGSLKIKHKIFVAGNHDGSIERKFVRREKFHQHCIHYLENESVEIDLNEGWKQLANSDKIGATIVPSQIVKIWGSPITPTFGDWSFMKSRNKLHDLWLSIPEDTDIVVTHGPPAGILDLTYDRAGKLECCGCTALKKRMLYLEPKLCLFGHLHNYEEIVNAGQTKLTNYKTIFSNGSCVTDRKFGMLSSHGNVFEI